MKNFLRKIYDYFLGIHISFGLAMAIWLLLTLLPANVPLMNMKNVLFLFLSVIVPWITNFVFDYSSSLYMKGILHGGLWFMTEIIIFNFLYGVALEANVLIVLLVAAAILYGVGLFVFSRISGKLNIPVRCVSQFHMKVVGKITKD
ncbi:MAG: hypothetical protein IJE10_03550 [Clostridia bacterium]|nr:hypothetical protein [Clostridia bacterium]